MSCWMSRWNDNPTIEYILCASAHIVVTICIFQQLELFLPCQVRMRSINLLLCNKYYVTAGIYTVNQPCQMTADSVEYMWGYVDC